MQAAGLRNADLAKIVGIAASTITYYRQGQTPSAEKALAICRALNISMEWWIEGAGGQETEKQIVLLPVFGEKKGSLIPYAHSVVTYLGVNADRLFVLFVHGNMMAPTIPEGAEVIVCTDITPLKDGCIYLVRMGEREVLRRIRFISDGRIQIVCDNPLVSVGTPEFVDEENIIAEAVWTSSRPRLNGEA